MGGAGVTAVGLGVRREPGRRAPARLPCAGAPRRRGRRGGVAAASWGLGAGVATAAPPPGGRRPLPPACASVGLLGVDARTGAGRPVVGRGRGHAPAAGRGLQRRGRRARRAARRRRRGRRRALRRRHRRAAALLHLRRRRGAVPRWRRRRAQVGRRRSARRRRAGRLLRRQRDRPGALVPGRRRPLGSRVRHRDPVSTRGPTARSPAGATASCTGSARSTSGCSSWRRRRRPARPAAGRPRSTPGAPGTTRASSASGTGVLLGVTASGRGAAGTATRRPAGGGRRVGDGGRRRVSRYAALAAVDAACADYALPRRQGTARPDRLHPPAPRLPGRRPAGSRRDPPST